MIIMNLVTNSGTINYRIARAGGGGSSSGGGGHSSSIGHSSSHSYSSSGSHASSTAGTGAVGIAITLVFFAVFFLMFYSIFKTTRKNKTQSSAVKKKLVSLAATDPMWDENYIIKRIEDIFLRFQNDWSNLDTSSMQEYLVEGYYKRMVLELNVLQNEKRKNLVKNPKISDISIEEIGENFFLAEITANADDSLVDTGTGQEIYADKSSFTEFWKFVKDDKLWKLEIIAQATEDEDMVETEIADFAAKNNFYFDPDFGWLMMPNKGVIFSKTKFTSSDINNHVIGYYKDKIVEFYTYLPSRNNPDKNYLVAQVILPLNYKDILVKKKSAIDWNPQGLNKIELESNDFNMRFNLWADPDDQVSSLELLTPNFMERIYGLPFDLNIEIVGSFLYFYVEGRKNIKYDQMLEIIIWAFDEMKI
jgi:hypothetical protein